jgi:hypothetical protein
VLREKIAYTNIRTADIDITSDVPQPAKSESSALGDRRTTSPERAAGGPLVTTSSKAPR